MPGFEVFGDEERKEVMDVLETGVLFRYGFDQARKGRWKAKEFEEKFALRLGARHCHLCSSGTAADHIALAAAGVGAGDEVIVPPFTFVATIEAVLAQGAVPVFAEMDGTLCLDPASVAERITPKTKAVVPVHICGSMARIDALADVCRERGVIMVEDACQAVGGSYKGKALGTFGALAAFSFDPVKTLTAGEGGAVVTSDDALYARVHQFADHGHDHIGNDRGAEGHPITGFNYRICELNAAVALAQIGKLDRILAIQRNNKAALKAALGKISGVTFREVPDPEGDTATFLSFLLPSENEAREAAQALAKAGLPGVFYWYDNNWHYHRRWDHFKTLAAPFQTATALAGGKITADTPRSDALMGRTICLSIGLLWTEADIAGRIQKLESVLCR
jgi:8-amino-3,8-dideoxy-alpha-D-manno-octulosonate transaminase